jgi:glycosyltransferase involved in cell wall biosynthesis/cephalosporin hydroxylase
VIRALIVAFHFPPIGGGGVQRSVKFTRYLPEFGVEPVVLTVPAGAVGPWTPPDPTMLAEVEGIETIRVAGTALPGDTGSLRERFERIAGMESELIRWWNRGVLESGLVAGRDVDVILGELVPYETAFGVSELARRLNLPWVADLQDPWALDEMWLYPSGLHRLRDRRRMRRTLATAAAVVMNTPEARKRVRREFPEFAERRVVSITNGFDAEDFEGPVLDEPDGVFRIVHTGYLHTELGQRHRRRGWLRRGLGGMPVPGVDYLTRSHVYLLDAIARVLRRDPSLRGVIELHLAGKMTDADHRAARGYPFVKFHGYLAHAESVALVRRGDLLFLPMQDMPAGTRAGLVPGKTFEYLGSGKPLLAAVPDGDARDLLLRADNATLCRPAAVECLADAIHEAVERWRAGIAPSPPDPAVVAECERRALTAALAELLEDVVDRPSTRNQRPSRAVAPQPHDSPLARDVRTIAPIDAPPEPRWLRAVHRASAPVASPVAAHKLHRLTATAATADEIAEIVCTFAYAGVSIAPLQVPSELAALLDYVRVGSPRTVVEIGTALGGTFCALAWAAADDATLISVDLRHGEFGGGYPRWRALLYRSFKRSLQRVVLIQGDSHRPDTLDAVRHALRGAGIDVLFIDGDHTFEGVRADFEMYSPLVRPGGLVAFHDIVTPDPARFPNVRVCAGGVPGYWAEIKQRYEHLEFVEDWRQGAFGIGVIQLPGGHKSDWRGPASPESEAFEAGSAR